MSIKLLEEIEKKEALEKYGSEGSGKNLPFSSLSEDLKKKVKIINYKEDKLAIVKSKLLKQLSKNYPNFLKKDLEKFSNIILNEIKKKNLIRNERVEFRGFGVFSSNLQKREFLEETQKLVKKSILQKKKQFTSKCRKICLKN